MKKYYCYILLPFLIACGTGSQSLPPSPYSNLVLNGSFELFDSLQRGVRPRFWQDSLIEIFQSKGYEFGITDQYACCDKYSAYITANEQDNYAVWIQPVSTIPIGRKVRLSASVKTEDLTGRGFEFGVMCKTEDQSSPRYVLFTSRAYTTGIVGSRDWATFVMSFEIPAKTSKMEIWLALQTQTTGAVYFDAVELKVI